MASFDDQEKGFDPRIQSSTYKESTLKKDKQKYETGKKDKKKPEEMDHFFLLIMSIIIFFMQCGFAFMEAGAVR